MSLDWPLSREEKKSRLLLLYDNDVQALNETQRFDELRIEVLRQELRAAHRRGDIPGCGQPRRSSLNDLSGKPGLPVTATGSSHSALARPLLEEGPLALRTRPEHAGGPVDDPWLAVFGFAKEAVDGGVAAWGSFWASAAGKAGSDSDEVDFQCKLRARSEGARTRNVAAAPALKKPNSRRNSRGPALRVSFEDSDDEGVNGKASVQEDPLDKILMKTHEEQEPMGEPEPAADKAGSIEEPCNMMLNCSRDTGSLSFSQPTIQEQTWQHVPEPEEHSSACDRGRGRSAGDFVAGSDIRNARDAPGSSRRELRVLLDVRDANAPQELERSASLGSLPGQAAAAAAAKLSKPAMRRARLRGRLHGYSICDATDEQ